jgi:hypothetical protein
MRDWDVQPGPEYLLPTEVKKPPWRGERAGEAVAREVRRVRVRAKVVVGKCMVGFVGGWMVGVCWWRREVK